jgi:hypothetical protein
MEELIFKLLKSSSFAILLYLAEKTAQELAPILVNRCISAFMRTKTYRKTLH